MMDSYRFAQKVEVVGECVIFTGSKTSKGYGRFRIGSKIWKAHRAAWLLFKHEQPPPIILHKCGFRDCVNPDHLRAGTVLENNQEVNAKRRRTK